VAGQSLRPEHNLKFRSKGFSYRQTGGAPRARLVILWVHDNLPTFFQVDEHITQTKIHRLRIPRSARRAATSWRHETPVT